MMTMLRQLCAMTMLGVAATLGVPAIASAAPSNVVTLDFVTNSNDDVTQLSVKGSNRIYILGALPDFSQTGVFGLDLTNPLGNTFGTNGRFLSGLMGLIVHADGSFVDLEAKQGGYPSLTSRDPQGNVVGTPVTITLTAATLAGEQPDGKVLIGGAFDGACHSCNYAAAKVIRVNSDGSVDQTFNSVQLAVGAGSWSIQAVPMPDGKIVVRFGGASTVIAMLNSDGTLATSFGLNSTVTFAEPVRAVAVDSQNRIYVATGTNRVQRVLEDGSIDSTFDATAAVATGTLTSLTLDSMQRPVVFGYVPGADGAQTSTALVARLTTAGALDTTFANTGHVAVPLPKPLYLFSTHSCTGDIQVDDKPVIACDVEGEGSAFPKDVAIARYNVDGTADSALGATIPNFQYYPDAFAFQNESAAYGAAYVVSNPVTISGTNVPTTVSVMPLQGGSVSIGCNGQFTNQPPLLAPGQTFCVRGSAPIQPAASAVVSVSVGGRIETFTINSTHTPATTTPAAFSFTNQASVEPSATVRSNIVTITGITGFATVTVSGDNGNAKVIIGCGSDDQGGILNGSNQIGPGQALCVQQLASSTYGESETATVTVGGVSAAFTITTKADPNPLPPGNTGGGSSGASGGGGGGAFDELSLAALAALSTIVARRRTRIRRRKCGAKLEVTAPGGPADNGRSRTLPLNQSDGL